MVAVDPAERPNPLDDVRISSRPSLVRMAILARFEYFDGQARGSDDDARRRVAAALGVKSATLSHRLSHDDRLTSIAMATEAVRVAPSEALSRLARRQLTTSDIERFHVRLPPHWWAQMQRAVFDDSGRLRARSPVEVLAAADCFIAHHAPKWRPDLLEVRRAGDERPWAAIEEAELHYARELIRALCRLTAGPYGAASEARDLLVLLAPAAPELVMQFAEHAPNGQKVLIPLDRTMRVYSSDHALHDTIAMWLVSQPPSAPPSAATLMLLRTLCRRTSGAGATALRDRLAGYVAGAVEPTAEANMVRRRAALWIAWELGMAPDVSDPSFGDVMSAARSARADLGEVNDFVEWDGFLDHVPNGSPAALGYVAAVQEIDRRRPARRRGHWSLASPNLQQSTRRLLAELLVTPCLLRRRRVLDALDVGGPAIAGPAAIEAARVLVRAAYDPEVQHIATRAAYVAGALRELRALDAVRVIALDDAVPIQVRALCIGAIADIVHRNQHAPEVGRGLDALTELAGRDVGPLTGAVVRSMAAVRRTRFERLLDDPPGRWPESVQRIASWGKDLLDDPMLPAAMP